MHPDTIPWQDLIQALRLQPHPEGGYYRETFRARDQIAVGGRTRAALTSIYYLLVPGTWSAWHRIDADETWYFHIGGPLRLHVLTADGTLQTHVLGDVRTWPDAVFQATVPAGCWFAAEPALSDAHVLVSCAVAPGFEFSGFQLASASDLEAAVRRHGDWLMRLIRRAPAA